MKQQLEKTLWNSTDFLGKVTKNEIYAEIFIMRIMMFFVVIVGSKYYNIWVVIVDRHVVNLRRKKQELVCWRQKGIFSKGLL